MKPLFTSVVCASGWILCMCPAGDAARRPVLKKQPERIVVPAFESSTQQAPFNQLHDERDKD